MTASKNVNATGVVIIREKESAEEGGNDFCSMHIPEAGSDRSVVMVMKQGNCHGIDPRFIELNSFPSATTILLTSNTNGTKDNASFWVELKTTRTNAALGNNEVTYLNAYAVGDFPELNSIGLIVIGKHGTIARDKLGSVRVTTSAVPPTVLDQPAR